MIAMALWGDRRPCRDDPPITGPDLCEQPLVKAAAPVAQLLGPSRSRALFAHA